MYPDWLDREEYPFAWHAHTMDGAQMHYVDEGRGEVVLFVHGTPSWSFEWRHLIKRLSPNYRCIAPDHIGFGLSDKPRDYDYTTPGHSSKLERLIEHLELEDITLVLHDFGGPIGLNYALNHPGNISQLVLLNTWMKSFKEDPRFQQMKPVLESPVMPLLYKYLNFSATFLLPRTFVDKKVLTNKIKKHYSKPFGSPSERRGTVAFAHSLVRDQDWFEQLWDKREVISDKRTLFIWGMGDEFISAEHLEEFERAFHHSKTIRLDNVGHFPQEEKSEAVASTIEGWMRERMEE